MAENDFQIETFDNETFSSVNTVETQGSRDKAYALKQNIATNQRNWSNDSQKYLAQRNYVESIRNAFALTRDALESFKKTGGIVEAAERFNIQYFIERQLGYIGSCTEQFWDEFSHFKDRLSYKFGSRHFPTNDGRWAESFNDDNKTTVPAIAGDRQEKTTEQRRKEIAELQRVTMDRISKQYDINDAHLKNFMDRTYVDGDVGGSYSPLDPSQYFDLIGLTDMEYLFKMAYEAKLYGVMLLMWCHFVSSKQFVHLILNSEYILNLMFNPNIYSYEVLQNNKLKTVTQNPFADDKYREIINHYMFYGIYVLCREEYYVKTKATDDLRYLLDIRCVSKLPIFDGPLSMNPYMPVTLSEKYLYGTETPVEDRVIRPMRAAAKGRGLYGLDSCKSRFEAFTDGVLDGLDFDRLYFTGSIIAACCVKNPLEKKFGIELLDENKATVYWMTNKKNLVDYFNEYYPGKGVLDTTGLTNAQLAELEEDLTDIDCIVDALEDAEFDRLSVRLYECIKTNLLKRHKKHTLGRDDLNITKIETNQSYKYYIDGKMLVRSLELFRIYDLRPVGCISRFHFAPVRGYYNGTTVYVLPSMLCAAQTGICTDYKWFSDSKKPQTLICKYYLRGFHVLLNSEEQADMRRFMADNPAWSMLDELPCPASADEDTEVDDPGKNRDVTISIMNPIFNPRMSRLGCFSKLTHLNAAPTLKYVQDADVSNLVLPKTIESQFGVNLAFRYPAGHVKPVNLWYVTPYARDLSRSKKYAAIV